MIPTPDDPAPGQESVWSYSRRCIRTLETSHPPGYYVPPEDVVLAALRPSTRRSFCEWKGHASYFDVFANDQVLHDAAWTYRNPGHDFAILRDHVAFYPARFSCCLVDGEQVIPQSGGFYGGWITSHVSGPFKGVPGSTFW